VVDCWYRLGIQLGVTEDDLNVIEQNYPRDAKMQRAKMFGTWLRSDISATYEKLIKALMVVGKLSLAEKLCRKYGTLLENDHSHKGKEHVTSLAICLWCGLCIAGLH